MNRVVSEGVMTLAAFSKGAVILSSPTATQPTIEMVRRLSSVIVFIRFQSFALRVDHEK